MRPECEKCELDKTCIHPYMQPEGPIETVEILFVAEAPGEQEDLLHRPLVGESGQILRRALIKAKLEDPYDLNPSTNYAQTPLVKNVVLYNVCVCRPVGNDTPTGVQIKCCFDNTLDLIKRMPRLKLIVPVGNIALRAFTSKQGITSVSGKEMKWEGYKMMPLLHPASFLYAKNRSKIKIFYDHVARIPVILQDNLVTDDAGKYVTIETIQAWRELKAKLLQQPEFTYDIETTGRNPFEDGFRIKLITFNFVYKEVWALPVWDQIAGECWNDLTHSEIINDLKEIFENEDIGKIGHNVKYDNMCMRVVYDIQVAGTIGDTKLSQYILHPQDSDNLKDMSWSYSGLGSYEKNLSVATQDASLKELIPYGCRDADLTGRISSIHKKEFGNNPILFSTYRNLFVPVQVVLSNMEYNGIRINPPRLNDSYTKTKKILDKTIEDITNYPSVTKYIKKYKKEFNIDSDPQIRMVLFGSEYEKLTPIKMTSKLRVPSTDKTVFEHFADKNPLAALLSIYSKYTAVMKTINEIKANLTPDNRIHTSYWITSTFSGRSSSSNPNLQNLPKGDNDPVLIRKAFIADDDYYLVEFDFNQHELRCMAEEADDDAMRKACISGDVHRATTANLLGIRPEDVTDDQRRNIGKVFNFGLIYGMTVYGIAKKMKLVDKIMIKDRSLSFRQAKWLAEKEAQILLDKFFEVYFKIKQWMDKTSQFVIDNRYVTMRSGLVKYFPSDIKLTDHELRSAINTPIQGLAGHILFYALIGVDKFVTFNKLLSKLLLEVHDSIVMGIHKSELEIIPEIKHIMTHSFKKFIEFKTPLAVDAKIGENWKIMEEI